MQVYGSTPLPNHFTIEDKPTYSRSKFALAAIALTALGVGVGYTAQGGMTKSSKTLTLTTDSSLNEITPSSFPRMVATTTDATSSDKVDVYIIAEAFCPNCKEHSYLFDTLIMNQGDDMREIMDISLDMLVLDGWFSAGDEGICEKGKYDCIAAQYHLAAQKLYKDSETHTWWDFSRCLFKHQPELIAYYTEEGHETSTYMDEIVSSCASDAALDYDDIEEMRSTEGNHLLQMSYGRTIEYDMPVWIYVNGKYIEYEDDWINAICAAYDGDSNPSACIAAESLDGGDVALKSDALFEDNGKVDVYIVAEAMCPNCKEHSYYFDNLVMSPEGVKSSIRSAINLKLEQMIIDGWDTKDFTGICEKGKWDCELSKYQLCAQAVDTSDDLSWWDYSRCLYKHQTSMIDYYYDEDGESAELMTKVHAECASQAGVSATEIKSCVKEEGTELLYEGFERIGKMSDPVWIYVNNQRIDYHEDWLATICASATERGFSVEECNYYADV